MGDPTEGVYFRFPPGLYDRVKEAARERDVSANSEVVRRLERSFETDEAKQPPPWEH